MNDEEILRHMHKCHLLLSEELRRICEKYNIKYFMIAGTMLGAIRHKGFIPWDDDMDFGMLRKDFEKFLKVSENELDTKTFYLQTDRNDKYYAFNFAKLRLNGTKVLEEFSMNVNTNQGIYIDIFPIDAVEDQPFKAMIQYKSFWLFRNLLWVKCGYGDDGRKKTFGYKLANICAKPFSIKFLKRLKYKSITCCKNKNTKRVVTSDGSYGLKRETLNALWVNKLAEYKFENHYYPGIADFDSYLTYFYNDYMKIPPENKRNHHHRLDVYFGKY